jgi:mannan endo-1,4-beta-mannosidase
MTDPTIDPTVPRRPVDPGATAETAALLANLAALQGKGTLFGHQDALSYGYDWTAGDGRCDVAEVTGAYPAVLGFDVGRLETGAARNIDGVDFEDMVRWIRQGRERGCLVTISWHSVNPITGGGYDANVCPDAIRSVLPGGSHHAVLLEWLDRFAEYDRRLVDESGTPIPIVFRPYHEHSGDWFWWGVGNGLNRKPEFTDLWRFTFEYLHGVHGLHNLLWSISPDRSRMDVGRLAEDYLSMYPGDEYVDVLGVDNYADPHAGRFEDYVRTLEALAGLAAERGKLAAQTETGNAAGERPWTDFLLRASTASEATRRILWSLVWRNPNGEEGGAPHRGSPTEADFRAFHTDPFTRFADTLPDLYAPPTGAAADR